MQPPRRRAPRFSIRSTRMLRSITLHATAVLVTLLIARVAVLLVAGPGDPVMPRMIERLTGPLAWPFRQLPILNVQLSGELLLADLFIIGLVLLLGLLVAGVLTGWRESASRRAYRSDPFG